MILLSQCEADLMEVHGVSAICIVTHHVVIKAREDQWGDNDDLLINSG